MKYKDIDIEKARKVCRTYRKKCERCPLRRIREYTTEQGTRVERTLMCWWVLNNIMDEENQKILDTEEIYKEKEWMDYLESVE